jgi:hypothetical protein
MAQSLHGAVFLDFARTDAYGCCFPADGVNRWRPSIVGSTSAG